MADLVVQWFRDVLSKEEIAAPDKAILNGYSTNAAIWEAMESLYDIRNRAGTGQRVKVTKEVWESQVKLQIPEIDKALNRPKLIKHINEYENEAPITWLIQDEVPAESLIVLYGQSGAAKSFQSIDYAAQIAREQNVIYIAAEGRRGYYARYHAWLQHCGYKKAGKFHLVEKAVQFLREPDVNAFIDECEEYHPALVVIDTLSRCMVGGDENSQKDMGMFVYACDQIRERLKCAVMVIHHTGKTGDNERGSSVLRAAADMMISLTNEEGIIKIACGKSKDSKPFNHRYCRLLEITIKQNGQDVVSCVLEQWQRVKFERDELTPNQVRLLECLASELFSDGVRVPDLKAYSNIQGSSFYNALNALMKRTFVKKLGRGAKIDPVIITQDGMDWIRYKANPESMEMGMEMGGNSR